MHLESLRTFLHLATLKSFTKTAYRQSLVQSTVSSRIKELEKEIGYPLIIRNKNDIALTPHGEEFLLFAKKVLALEDEVRSDLNLIEKYASIIKMGAVDSIYEGTLRSRIVDYLSAHPEDSLQIQINHGDVLINMLEEESIDLAFTYTHLQTKKLESIFLREDLALLVAGPHTPLEEDALTLEDLRAKDLICVDMILKEEWYSQLFSPYQSYRIHIDVIAKAIPLLLSLPYYCFLPQTLLEASEYRQHLRIVPLQEIAPPVMHSFCTYRNNSSSKNLQKFLRHMACLP